MNIDRKLMGQDRNYTHPDGPWEITATNPKALREALNLARLALNHAQSSGAIGTVSRRHIDAMTEARDQIPQAYVS